MSLTVAFGIARRELRGGIRGFRVFLACLALGVAAIAAVGTVRESINAGLEREGASLLGGDAAITLTYRFATPQERAWMADNSSVVSEIVDFRSLAVSGDGSDADRALTQVKAVDDAYPLYGTPVLEPNIPLDQALAGRDGLPGAVMDRVLMDRLRLTPGDRFRLGLQDFVLGAGLVHEPDGVAAGFGLGPRTIVRTVALANSGLLEPGTLFETSYRLRLDDTADLNAVRASASRTFEGAGLRWQDRRDGAPGIAEFVGRLGAFLVLVGLAGLAVGGVGISAAVKAYLDGKTGVIATLKTLGADRRTVFAVYFLQVSVMAGVGIAIGLVLGVTMPLVLAPVIEPSLPFPAEFSVYPRPLAEATVYGVLTALLFTIWPLARTEDIRAAALFRDAGLQTHGWPRPIWVGATVLLLAALVAMAVAFTGLTRLTVWSAAGILVAFVALLIVSGLVRELARRAAHLRGIARHSTLRMALGSVGGPGAETTSVVLSLGLGLSVLAAIGQIDSNLRGAIARDLPEIAPSYFVVDIQNAQLDEFKLGLTGFASVTRVESAPMLRGVITRINGRPASETAGDHWVLQGDRGITYSAEPPPGTTITDGHWWRPDHSGPAEVSFAAEEAAEMNLAIGDSLTVNVLGRDIDAQITSFREVDFSTAGIGFVLSMNPAALAGAPHTHIATIYAEPSEEGAILRDLSDRFPNITAIRVRDAIARVSEVLEGIASAVTYGALATLVTGGIVLIGAAAAGERARTYEAAVLKTLGAERRTIMANFALRSAFLGIAAGLVAVAVGGLAGWAVMTRVMDSTFEFEPVSALMIVTAGVGVTLVAGMLFSWRPLSARPAQVLRARE